MGEEALRDTRLSRFEQLRYAQEILRIEGHAILDFSRRLSDDFCQAVDCVLNSRGSIVVTGMGKAGLIGQKIAATLSSTGTSSQFLHPAEAVHGDLGRVRPDDTVLALSFSGETEEVVRLIPSFNAMGVRLIAITGCVDNSLAEAADIVIALGPLREACCLGLAPSTSTTVMLAIGDALALVVSRMQNFGAKDFARFHPGGSLGRQLALVGEVMRPLAQSRVANETHTVRQVIVRVSRPGRRTGAIMLVDDAGHLRGLFTDSDLARILEDKQDQALDLPVAQVMTRHPVTVGPQVRLNHAIDIMAAKKISEIPVVNDDMVPLGILDVTDVVGLGPVAKAAAESQTDPNAQPPLPVIRLAKS